MGKWNRRYTSRPRHRHYQDYKWSPPRDEPCPDPETEEWHDNVPMWEKKFCYLVGRMPWKKVLSTKNFMHCHNNILSWDDAAGEESFLNAKTRFWEESNGRPCESQLPDPNMYIDAIDWNPYIDPELVRELDREYFHPDDKYYLPSCSTKANNGWPDDVCSPWESTKQNPDKTTGWNTRNHQLDDGDNDGVPGNVQKNTNNWADKCDRATDWNQWDNSVNDRYKSSKHGDPWESHCTRDNTNGKNSAWTGAWQNPSGPLNDWSTGGSNSWRNDGKRWHDPGDSFRAWNQKKVDYNRSNYLNNNYKPREFTSYYGDKMTNGRGNTRGQKQWDSSNWEPRDSSDNSYRGRGHFNPGCRKRAADQYGTNHKGPILHGADSQSTRFWDGANNKRVSFGGRW